MCTCRACVGNAQEMPRDPLSLIAWCFASMPCNGPVCAARAPSAQRPAVWAKKRGQEDIRSWACLQANRRGAAAQSTRGEHAKQKDGRSRSAKKRGHNKDKTGVSPIEYDPALLLIVSSMAPSTAAVAAPSTAAVAASSPPAGPDGQHGSESIARNSAASHSAKRSRPDLQLDTDGRAEPKDPTSTKRRRLSRLLRYRGAKQPFVAGASHQPAAIAVTGAGGDGAPDWGALPAELVSAILNGCDDAGKAFLHPRWRTIARAVCRAWRNVVENPAAPDAVRIAARLADPHPSLQHLWSKGRLLCASAVAKRLRYNAALAPESAVAWASRQARTPMGPFLTAAALVASARADAIAYAFSRHVSRAAVTSLRAWLRCAVNRTRDMVLRPPATMATDCGLSETPLPDAWWAMPRAGGPALRPWEGMRHVVGGCARAALAGLLLRVASRHASIGALDMLLTVSDPPCGVADAAFEAAAAGHAAFTVRMLMLVAASGDRTRSAVVCYQAWLGAAAGGHTRVMHALLDAESGRGTLATALWRGRCLADGSPRHPRTASHIALAHDRAGYFEVLRDREHGSGTETDDGPLWFAKTYLAEALRVGALGVARWIAADAQVGPIDKSPLLPLPSPLSQPLSPTDATASTAGDSTDNADKSTNDTTDADRLAALGSRAIVEVVVDGRGPRESARRTIVWMRDNLGAEPSAATLGVLVRSAHAFRWARPESAAARGRLSASRYARLLDLLVDVIEVWPHAAATEIERDDEEEQEDMVADVDPYYMCLARDGGGHAYGACVVRLLVERVSHGRIAGDRYDRRHARRRALSALDRMAAVVAQGRGDDNATGSSNPRHGLVVDPWAVAAARVTAEIAAVDRSGRSPMRSIDALLGMAALACRCLLSTTVKAAASSDSTHLPAVILGLASRLCERGIVPDDARARLWRRWCRLPAERETNGNEFDCIGAWAERIAAHTVFV
nr:hypothetical protein [Pandoravirus massiliensis]